MSYTEGTRHRATAYKTVKFLQKCRFIRVCQFVWVGYPTLLFPAEYLSMRQGFESFRKGEYDGCRCSFCGRTMSVRTAYSLTTAGVQMRFCSAWCLANGEAQLGYGEKPNIEKPSQSNRCRRSSIEYANWWNAGWTVAYIGLYAEDAGSPAAARAFRGASMAAERLEEERKKSCSDVTLVPEDGGIGC